tara:strand:+ start:85 stop:486 length:402 start_codon:yes stop_codon:yes gene_type:complete
MSPSRNSLVDEFDERYWDSNRGVEVGVKHGGSVHQPTVTYSDIPMGRSPSERQYKYGEFRPPVIIDFRKQPDNPYGVLTPPGSTKEGTFDILTPPGSTEKGKLEPITPPSSSLGGFEGALANLFLRRFLEGLK